MRFQLRHARSRTTRTMGVLVALRPLGPLDRLRLRLGLLKRPPDGPPLGGPVRPDGRLHPIADGWDLAWLSGSLPFDFNVGSLVPRAFERYARILHPARTGAGTPVRWQEVAAWSGGTVHRLAQWVPMAYGRGIGVAPAPYDDVPPVGSIPLDTLDALVDVLRGHTTAADRCCFGVWEGRGWYDPDAIETLRLVVPNRTYLLFAGPLDGVGDVGWAWLDWPFQREAPNLMWPEDRQWWVATEVDLDSTFVGGSAALITALLEDPRLEAWEAFPDDPIDAGSDEVNTLWPPPGA